MSHAAGLILPVIMCGGSGTRLWPISRASKPKQFVPLVDDVSTFQETVKRIIDPSVFLKPVVIASLEHRFLVAEQLAEIGVSAHIILEPARRYTAATVAVAAAFAREHHPDAVLLVMAADHIIKEPAMFVEACQRAAPLAADRFIMTLGITPTYPATSYGYIARGAAIDGGPACEVNHFVEKPDAATAAEFISRDYLWNSGYFLFSHHVMLDELARHAPEILEAASEALRAAVTDADFIRLDKERFEASPKISVDYAVIEKTDRAAVLPVSFSWSDAGNWDAIWSTMGGDMAGNVLRGKAEVRDTTGSLVHSDELLTTVVGLSDVVVVATADAVLVCSRKSAEDVKDLVTQLRGRGHPEVDEHLRVHRPWGWYQRLDVDGRFRVKRIMVKPGSRLSLQKHFHRAEHWVVVRGAAEVTIDDRVTLLHETQSAYIPVGAVHRLANLGRIPLEIIEVQVGAYTGEDDIVRIEDVYGRG